MIINGHDINKKIFIVAEIGNNHEGNFNLAKQMIRLAAESGADAVKFQTIIPEFLVSNIDKERLLRLRSFQFSFDQFVDLKAYALKVGVTFFSTPFDIESAKFLNQIQAIFKIASGDNNFFPMIDLVASFGKPIIVSTGLANLDLVDKLNERILNIWKSKKIKSDLAFLHCVSSYPVPYEHANIGFIKYLSKRYPNSTIGYSDHTIGTEASECAVSMGARIVEKHFTIDKNYSDFRDHQLSADPEELKNLVKKIRFIEKLIGKGLTDKEKFEESMKKPMRRSIAAKTNLKAGTQLAIENITWVRPGNGIPPGNEKLVIGKKLKKSFEKGQIIKPEDIEDL